MLATTIGFGGLVELAGFFVLTLRRKGDGIITDSFSLSASDTSVSVRFSNEFCDVKSTFGTNLVRLRVLGMVGVVNPSLSLVYLAFFGGFWPFWTGFRAIKAAAKVTCKFSSSGENITVKPTNYRKTSLESTRR